MKHKCEGCKGTGKTFFGDKNYNCLYCDGLGYLNDNWEKEFKDLLFRGYCKNAKQMFIGCEKRDIAELLDKYIYQGNQYPVCDEVKIKCKDGCIQIERVK